MTLNESMTAEVLAVLDQYVAYYNAKDQSRVLSLFSKNIAGFGTAKDEIITNFAGVKKQFSSDLCPSNAIRISIQVLSVGGEMPVAWITGLCKLEGAIDGNKINIDGRMTAVLANRGGRWFFEQIHFSVPSE